MKNSIRLTALFLLVGTGAFAAGTTKTAIPMTPSTEVAIKGLGSKIGVNIVVEDNLAAKPLVTIVDGANNTIYKGRLSSIEGTSKSFDLANLDTGDYSISVVWNNHEVKKVVHIYDEEIQKRYVIN